MELKEILNKINELRWGIPHIRKDNFEISRILKEINALQAIVIGELNTLVVLPIDPNYKD